MTFFPVQSADIWTPKKNALPNWLRPSLWPSITQTYALIDFLNFLRHMKHDGCIIYSSITDVALELSGNCLIHLCIGKFANVQTYRVSQFLYIYIYIKIDDTSTAYATDPEENLQNTVLKTLEGSCWKQTIDTYSTVYVTLSQHVWSGVSTEFRFTYSWKIWRGIKVWRIDQPTAKIKIRQY